MSACVQCRIEIDGIAWRTYHVGWCQKDVHQGACFALHVRVCAACRWHNEGLANTVRLA